MRLSSLRERWSIHRPFWNWHLGCGQAFLEAKKRLVGCLALACGKAAGPAAVAGSWSRSMASWVGETTCLAI
jgi:hypothetical protein